MDFDFSDDQTQLQDAVARYVGKAYPFERRQRIEAAGGFEATAWQELSDLGLPGLCAPDEHGGMALGPVECMLVQMELGRGLVMEPVAQSWLASVLLEAFAPAEMRREWLPQVASGSAVMAYAHSERACRYGVQGVEALIEKSGKNAVDTARTAIKLGVNAAPQAKAFLFTAQLEGQLALYLAQAGAPGLRVHPHPSWGGGASGQLELNGTPVQLVTADGAAAAQLAQDVGVAQTCAYAVGAMEAALKLTAEYLNTRKQFGVSISSFQALRHRVADMKMQLELARGMSYLASLKLGAPAAERSHACSMAKVQLSQSLRLVRHEAVQLHGGIGVTQEYAISHYFRALTALELEFGDGMHHLGMVSAAMSEHSGVFA